MIRTYFVSWPGRNESVEATAPRFAALRCLQANDLPVGTELEVRSPTDAVEVFRVVSNGATWRSVETVKVFR